MRSSSARFTAVLDIEKRKPRKALVYILPIVAGKLGLVHERFCKHGPTFIYKGTHIVSPAPVARAASSPFNSSPLLLCFSTA